MSAITRGFWGRELRHTSERLCAEDFVNLYKELAALVPQEINFEVYQRSADFCLYEYHSWPEWTFHWLPVSFIDRLEGPLKRIAITFIHEFAQSNGMSYLDEWGRSGVGAGVDGRICVGPNPDKEERRSTAARSDPTAKAMRFICWSAYKKRRYYKRLRQAVERYRPADEYEKGLIALFREGLQFIGSDTPSIMRYFYDPYDDEGIGDGITVDPTG